jgi:hypothetical protein
MMPSVATTISSSGSMASPPDFRSSPGTDAAVGGWEAASSSSVRGAGSTASRQWPAAVGDFGVVLERYLSKLKLPGKVLEK